MPRQELKDRDNRYLGYMDQIWPGRLEGCDKDNRFVGYYDTNLDETRDESNRLFGKGNMLAALIAARS
jgi:hypothetical protein